MGLQDSKRYRADIEAVGETIDFNQFAGSKILITGATGMIASVIVDMLMRYNSIQTDISKKIQIIAVSRNESKARERFTPYWENDSFSYLSHDMAKPLPDVGHVDYILHAASNTHPRAYATDPVGTITTNVFGSYHLLEYASKCGCKRFLLFSSVEIYGESRNDVDKFDEKYLGYIDCNTLRSGYPEAKRVSESLCNAFAVQKGLDFVIGRFSRVYGPTMGKDDSKAIAQFIQKAVAGEDIVLKSEGNQLYSYTYAVDAAVAALYLLLHGENGEAYNIADENSRITLKKLAEILAEYAGSKVIFDLPDAVERAGYSTATKAVLNIGKINELGWYAKVPIEEGLRKTVQILRETV